MFAKENNFYVNVGGGLPHQPGLARTETKKIKLERQSSDLATLSSVGDLASLGLGSLVTSSVPDPGLYQIEDHHQDSLLDFNKTVDNLSGEDKYYYSKCSFQIFFQSHFNSAYSADYQICLCFAIF